MTCNEHEEEYIKYHEQQILGELNEIDKVAIESDLQYPVKLRYKCTKIDKTDEGNVYYIHVEVVGSEENITDSVCYITNMDQDVWDQRNKVMRVSGYTLTEALDKVTNKLRAIADNENYKNFISEKYEFGI